MRILWKTLATLVAVPLSLMAVAFGLVLLNGGSNEGLGPAQGAMAAMLSLILGLVLILAVWMPGIRRRWLAALGGGVVAVASAILFIALGDLLLAATYSPGLAAGMKALGYLASACIAIYVMRRPLFTT